MFRFLAQHLFHFTIYLTWNGESLAAGEARHLLPPHFFLITKMLHLTTEEEYRLFLSVNNLSFISKGHAYQDRALNVSQ